MTHIYKALTTLLLATTIVACSDVNFETLPSIGGQGSAAVEPNPEGPAPEGPAYFQVENFTQGEQNGKLDIIVVIDNSPSMVDEQKKMGQKISSLLDALSNVDWQIGITTTDTSNGRHGIKGDLINFSPTDGAVLKKSDAEYKSKFRSTVQRKESSNCFIFNCPSSNEQPLAAAIMAMQKSNSTNRDLFRKDADLAILVISDEDEKSSGPFSATKPQAVLSAVESIFGSSKKVSAYGVIIQSGDNNCLNNQVGAAYFGTHVSELATITGGLTTSICAEDYGKGLKKIGDRAKSLLSSITLSHPPIAHSVQITFTPHQGIIYTVNGSKVQFNKAPAPGTEISIKYFSSEQ